VAEPSPVRTDRIVSIHVEEPTRIRLSPQLEHERRSALFDLLHDNTFQLRDGATGPYAVRLGIDGNGLRFDVRDEREQPLICFNLPLLSLRGIVKDYFLICDSYFKSIRTAPPSRIEAIDMGRRGLHNEGAEILRARLAEHVDMDMDTARRLFTLVCVLHIRR
jgi:uncharacterized protein (UPF0262 family)